MSAIARFDGHVKFDARIDSKKFKDDLDSIKSVSKKAFTAIGLAAGAMVTGVAAAGIGFESAFAGVKKTVNATTQELEALKGGIRDMAKEIPTAANEIAGIAEAAGQLGIKTENILEFTRVMADLGVATNLAGEEAASTLAKFANITQMPQEKFSNLGSTIVALGNNLATTEADIAAMSLRLAGAGTQAGLSEAQILSFAGALSSVGIEAEAGGSAFSRVMTDMQLQVETNGEGLKDYAKVAGMTCAEFKDAFQKDATGAIIEFIKGLNNTERNGKSATQVLAEMGIEEIRLSDALKRAAGASDVFENALKLGNSAWEENNALTKEAEQRYQTTESKLKILGNQVTDLGISAWDAFSGQFGDGIDAASDKIEELSASMENGRLKGAMENVGDLFGSLVDAAVDLAGVALPPLISTLGFVGENFGLIASVVGPATAAILAYKGATTVANVVETASMVIKAAHAAGTHGLNIAISLLNGNLLKETTLTTAKTVAEGAATAGTQAHVAAQTALNTALAINPIGLVIAGLTALVGVIAAVVIATKKSREEFLNMGDALDETTKKYSEAKSKAEITDDYAAKWRNLNDAIASGKLPAEELAQAEAERKECEQWFIDNYGSYISAEEQKSGIRKETVGLIQEEVALLSEKERIEAENAALEMKREVPDLAKEVNELTQKNKALEDTNTTLHSQNNVIAKALNEWDTWSQTTHTAAEDEAKLNEIFSDVNETLGTNYNSIANLETAYNENSKSIENNNKKIEKNNKELKDGTDSLQSYTDSCRKLIESDLGTSLETFGDKYQRINQALLDIANNGKISDETMAGLKEHFPDIAEEIANAEDPGTVLQGIMDDLNTKLGNAKTTAEEFGVELNGLPKDISINVKLNVPKVPSFTPYNGPFARGTRGAPEGPAVVNDGNGPELIQSKNGSFRMVQSRGAALTWLNKGDRVYTAEQTRSMLKHIPHYANGVGNDGITVSASTILTGVPQILGIAAEDIASTFSEKLGTELEKGLKENAEKMTEKFEKAVEVLDVQLDFGIISEEEYYQELKRLRDEYLTENTKEWYEATQEILDFEKKAAKESLDYRHDMGLITERQYYEGLEEYRDKYFTKDSDEWRDHTVEIFDYYKEEALKCFEDVADKQESMRDKLSDYGGFTKTVTIEGWNGEDGDLVWEELTDWDKNTEVLKGYADSILNVSERMKAAGFDADAISQFKSIFADMSIEEGASFAKLLASATDEKFYDYVSGYLEKQNVADQLSKEIYGDEFTAAADESASILTKAFETAGYEVPEGFFDIGTKSAENFSESFLAEIGNMMQPFRDAILSCMPASFSMATEGVPGGQSYTANYNFYSNGDTTAQQIQAAQAASERDKLSGGY